MVSLAASMIGDRLSNRNQARLCSEPVRHHHHRHLSDCRQQKMPAETGKPDLMSYPPIPVLDPVCTLQVDLGPIREMGQGRGGLRRLVPIIGGTVEGPLLNGRILDLGADWQTVFSDGLAELDTRYAVQTHDGATIDIRNFGFRHGPAEVMQAMARGEQVSSDAYYMRTQARLETGDSRYDWVNRTLFVGSGSRQAGAVTVALFAIR
jgi:hypothetical protein